MRRGAGAIRRGTSVIPGVSGRDRLDGQNAVFLVSARDDDVGSMAAVDRSPVKGPRYLERLIALGHGASNGDELGPAGGLVPETEGEYLRGDWKPTTRGVQARRNERRLRARPFQRTMEG